MQSEEMRLDGNAAAGVLRDLFTVDTTAAEATCGGCGKVGPIGALFEYGHEMGVVLRCTSCETPVLRIVRTDVAMYVDFSGLRLLRVSQ
ncbi:MAG TPA: DUF6510 family protein [Gemmatimonadaceae bacterium]|jgi:uncharacterized membrane protein|nr:DUF6510 family protein [Gemmatimonadaceae bacterium]